MVAMANRGADQNASQFFITTGNRFRTNQYFALFALTF